MGATGEEKGLLNDRATTAPAEEVEERRKPGGKHIPALDGLRGIAVLTVLLYHYGGGASSDNPFVHGAGVVLKLGWSGVTLFFLLSGFLITGILWDSKGQPHWWRNFYMRRALRIFPLYYGTLLAIAVMVVANHQWRGLRYVLVPVFYLQNFPPMYKLVEKIPASLTLYHYWSLAVEEQFYLVWPMLLLWMRTKRQAAWMCLTVFGLSILFRIWILKTSWAPGWELLPSRAGELALGGWLAFAYRSRQWMELRRWMAPVAVGAAVAMGVVGWIAQGFELEGRATLTMGLIATTICYGAVLGMALDGGPVQRVASMRWLRFVGMISFGVYVYHILLVHQYNLIARMLVPPGYRTVYLLTRLMVASVCSICIAWASYRFYESPFLRWKQRYSAQRSR